MKKYSSIITPLTLMFCVLFSRESLAQTQPWGTLLGYFNGVPNYSNGSGTYDSGVYNYGTGINSGLEWQCVEYVQRYYYLTYGMNLGTGRDAWQFYSYNTPSGLARFANGGTTAPQVGDILCFNETGSGLGHVAVVRAVDQANSVVHVIQQNVKNGASSPNGYGTDVDWMFAYSVSGGTYTVDVALANVGGSRLGADYYCQGWLRKTSSGRLSAPTLSTPLNAATGVSTTPSFSWSQVSGNQGYRIIVSTSASDLPTDPTQSGGTPANGFNQIVAQNTTTYAWAGTPFSTGTIYYWEVHALGTTLDQAGYWSSQNYFTTACTLPGFPGSPNPSNGATVTSQPTILDWSDASYATSYDVYLDGNFAANVTASQWTLNQSLMLGTHSWYVIAKNSCGQSLGPPAIWSFTINPANISVTVQSSVSGRSFTVDGTGYTTAQTFTWASGSSHTIATTSPQSGGTGIQYVWSSWSDSGAISHTVTPTTSTTYTANFTTQYYLTMGYGTGGSSVVPGSEWCNSGASIGISATAASGYSFSSWTGSGTGSYSGSSPAPTITMNSPVTELANFTQNSQNISVTVQPSISGRSFTVDGTGYTTAQTFTWTSGSSHTIATTSPQSGGTGIQYVWSSWSDSGAISHTVTPTTSTTYTANFTTQYYLTMGYGSGGSSVVPGSEWCNSGASIGISATAASGYSFSSWTGSGTGSYSGSSPAPTITMNGPITELANFITSPQTGSVTVNIDPPAAVSAGAQWQVDGGAWQNGGANVSSLSVGNHTVTFKTITGWTTPVNQTPAISANQTTTISGTYVAASNNPPQLTGIAASTNGMFVFDLNGSVGSNYVIQVSSDLVNWVNLVTNVIPGGGLRVLDFPIQTNQRAMYYRALPLAQGPLVLQPGPIDGQAIWTTSIYSNGTNTVGANGIADENFLVGGWGDYYYSYLKFDLTGLPAHATSATVQFYSFAGWHGGAVTVTMYLDRVTQDWDAIFATGIMKWVDQPASTNLRTIAAPVIGAWYSFDVTDLYNAWQAGTYPNYGIALRPTGNSDQFNYFWSSRYLVDPTLRPKLVIVP